MSDIQRYIGSVKKLCRSIETDFDLGEYVRDMARTVFKETEDHAKAIAELESQLSDVRELLEFKRQAIEELEDAISRRDCDYFEDMEAKSKSIEELKAEIERLKGVMSDVQNDLVQRADLKGEYHVNLSSSVWMALCECLPQPPSEDL